MKGAKFIIYGLIVQTFFIWIAIDVWVGFNGGPTESQTLLSWSERVTFFPCLIGILSGHWFFGRRANAPGWGWKWGGIALLALGAWDLFWNLHFGYVRVWYRFAGIWFLVGLPIGSYLWGQQDTDSPMA